MTTLIRPTDGSTAQILTEQQRVFLRNKNRPYDPKRQYNTGDYTKPPIVLFSWEADKSESVLEISEKEDFSTAHIIRTKERSVGVNNFKANQCYFWRVNGSICRSFVTEDACPRLIDADGTTNIRDMGNWRTKYGCRIKQGLIYRGSEMNDHFNITNKGRAVLRDELKIKTDLDLRQEWFDRMNTSPIGDDVNLVKLPLRPYSELLESYRRECRQAFDILSDRENYPIYYHCWGGADRTGTLAFFIGVVLGMYEEDLITDFEFTSLFVYGERSIQMDIVRNFIRDLGEFGGDTVNERAYNFLLTCGVTEEHMETVRKILLQTEVRKELD